MSEKKRIILGISGASGVIYGVKALEMLNQADVGSHLIISKAAERTLKHETNLPLSKLKEMATFTYSNKDIGASVASGSFKTNGMLIAPCSIKSMSEINCGITSCLMARAADVVLKEKRKLVMMVRETPLHTGHLRTMTSLSEIGAVIAPPVPAFYTKPDSLDDMVTQSIARVLDLFDIETDTIKRWGENHLAE